MNANAAVELRLVAHDGPEKTAHGLVVLHSVPDPRAADQQSVKREIAFTGGSVTIDEAPGSRWDVSLQAPGYWAPPLVVTLPPAGQSEQVQIAVWRTTTLRGRFRLSEKEPLPSLVTVNVESPPQPAKAKLAGIARGTHFDCQPAVDGSWTCFVPATTLDLAIRTKGYVPFYRWNVVLTPGKLTDLGDLRLQKGASVIAWLDSDSAKLLKEPAHATLTRMIVSEPSQTAARLGAPVAEATFNARGAVQLASLPPGTYVLTVSAKGFAPARAFPIEVFPGSETALRKPVRLEPPMTIRLSVRPPKDPGGVPWHVELHRVNDFGTGYDAQPAVRTRVDGKGLVEAGNQTPGSFQVAVRDHDGSVFVRRDLDLRERRDEETVIDVPLVSVRGKVLLGDSPFPSDLWFGGRHGTVSVKLTANEEGAFEGSLPHGGRWTVDVAGRSQHLDTVVKVEVGSDDLIVHLPDTATSGFVTDPEGGPLDQIEVAASASGGIVVARTKPDGTFIFRGLPESPVTLRARDLRTGRHSNEVKTSVAQGESSGRIELRLEPDHQVSGHVVSRGAPVIGARVTALMVGTGTQTGAVSNADGAFELQIPNAARRAWITVGAAGKSLQNYEVALTGAPLTLDLEPVGGTLVLTWPAGNFPSVARAGVPLMLPTLTAWARAQGQFLQGQKLRVPNVAPGPYRLCTMVPVKQAGEATPQPRCSEGALAPGGTLSLDVGS